MKTSKNNFIQESSRLRPGAFFMLMLIILIYAPAHMPASTGPGKDTSKVYPLDDPRNPDCPCHTYQDLADKEYAKLKSGNASSHSSSTFHAQWKRLWKHRTKRKRTHRIRKQIDGCSGF